MQSKEVQERMFNLVAGWSKSGLSQKVYCEQHSMRYHVFHYWFKRYREQQEATMGNGFIPLQVSQSIPGCRFLTMLTHRSGSS